MHSMCFHHSTPPPQPESYQKAMTLFELELMKGSAPGFFCNSVNRSPIHIETWWCRYRQVTVPNGDNINPTSSVASLASVASVDTLYA